MADGEPGRVGLGGEKGSVRRDGEEGEGGDVGCNGCEKKGEEG